MKANEGLPLMSRQAWPRMKRVFAFGWIALAIGAAIVIMIQGSSELSKQTLRLTPWRVALSFVIACSGLLVAVPVWRRILGSYGVHQTARDDIRIYCYSALGTTVPGGIWLIVGRTVLYEQLGVEGSRVAVASVCETFITGLAGMGLYGLATIVRPDISLWRRPEVGGAVSLLALLLLHPRLFNSLSGWMQRRLKKDGKSITSHFRYMDLVKWIGLEAIVVVIGGFAMYVLLSSLTLVTLSILVQVIAAWAAGVAASSLFFWLPGTPVLRDGALILALTPSLPLSVALVFVVLARVWLIVSLLFLAGILWLFFDRPRKKADKPFDAHDNLP